MVDMIAYMQLLNLLVMVALGIAGLYQLRNNPPKEK